jgi:hypothetical protein
MCHDDESFGSPHLSLALAQLLLRVFQALEMGLGSLLRVDNGCKQQRLKENVKTRLQIAVAQSSEKNPNLAELRLCLRCSWTTAATFFP